MSLRPIAPRPNPTRPSLEPRDAAGPRPMAPAAASTAPAPGSTARELRLAAVARRLVMANFTIERHGPFPPKVAGGFIERMKQNWNTVRLTKQAQDSKSSHGTSPSDASLRETLGGLKPMPTHGNKDETHVRYTSEAPGVPPDALFADLVQNPEQIFAASGLKMRPLPENLEHGQRFMLQDDGTPPVFFPMEVRLDPASRRLELACLDGHPFRGFNAFRFEDDGAGGTRVVQDSVFQASNDLAAVGFSLFNAAERQEEGWKAVHAVLAERGAAGVAA